MPRKKLEPIVALEPSPPVEPKPKKPKKKPEPQPEPAVAPVTDTKAAPSKGRSRKKSEPAPEVVASAPEVAEPAPVARAKKPAVKRAAKQAAPELVDPDGLVSVSFRPVQAAATPAPVRTPTRTPASLPVAKKPAVHIDGDEEFRVAVWRPRTKAPVSSGEGPAPTELAEGGEPMAGGRSRRRRTRGPKAEPETVAEATQPVPEAESSQPEPKEPELLKKPAIAIPEDAPQIVLRNGVPTIVRNHRVYPPIIFFGNPSDERKSDTVFEEIRMAAEAQVHLHSLLVVLEVSLETVDRTAEFAAYLLQRSLTEDPDAQLIFRIELQAPRGWESIYPKAAYRTAEGDLSEPSVCDDEFWGVAEQCLGLFVKKLRLLPASDHILGVHLERGEWFLAAGHGFDSSPAATIQFRNWARTRYLNDEVTLRASWFDGSIRFDTIAIPEFAPHGLEGDKFIRSSRRQRRYVDYHLFLSDATVHRISELAYAAKAAGEGYLLVGVSYGYTFEWSHPASGHLALGKLLRTEEIDFIGGPPSYRNRQPSGSAPFPCPIDSFALNGKLYVSEEDFKTSLSRGHEPDDFNPSLKTPQALESVHWRGAGVALAHASGVEWMDLWGNGWLRTNSVWERANRVRDALIDRMESPFSDPEVAVFIDERALAYLVDSDAFDLLVQNVRESVLRAGVSAAFYLLSDLAHREKFPESRLYLFLNAWDIRPELRAAIKSRLQRDDKVLFWLYSAGLFDAGRDSLERAREVTGIALKPQPFYSKSGTTILNRRHPLSEAFPDRSVVAGTKLEPSYFAIPEDGVVLGEYAQTGLPSFVVKEFREDPNARWTSVFLGEPVVNPALIRALAQMAGAHVWNFHEDVVHVRGPFCTIHCSGTGPRTITLPSKCCAYNLITADWAAIDTTNLRFVAIDGSTHVFLVGPKTEIEHFLNTNPEDALRIEHMPQRETNVRVDTSNFDVPIMKLDEWIEGGDQDEVADEWFLRPPAMVEEIVVEPAQSVEVAEQTGRRRRRRRRGRGGADDRGGNEEVVTARVQPGGGPAHGEEPFSMNVVFRKRE